MDDDASTETEVPEAAFWRMLVRAANSLSFICSTSFDSKKVSGMPSGTSRPVMLSTLSHSD